MADAKVLVVDANQDSRVALAHALAEAGYEAAVATSGSFALTMLEWEQPDLIVSYAKVQDMDGYELFTMVRRDPATKDTPFLLLAGRDRPIALAATEAGVDMTVTGDFTLATVMSRIKELLEKRIASQPLSLPNAGSVFRNPPGDHAARLIESCGLKGLARGGARVSEKHANFIVNPKGAARASDIEWLIERVRAVVQEKTGVALQVEVRIVGQPA